MRKILALLVLAGTLSLCSCAGEDIYIGENGNWWRGDEDLGVAATGPAGKDGAPGADGAIGLTGPQGEVGPQGEPGEEGPEGQAGPQGPKGDDGAPGQNGERGPEGEPGAEGPQGETGPQGPKGESVHVGDNGNWWIGDTDTGIYAGATEDGGTSTYGTDGLLFRATIYGGVAGYEVYGYTGSEVNIVIPDRIFGEPVISVATDALPKTVKTVTISKNTKHLPALTEYENLFSFDFNGAKIDKTAVGMFRGCRNLSEIKGYDYIEAISQSTFLGTAITNFDFSNVSYIGNDAFAGCVNMKFAYVPEGCEISPTAFPSHMLVFYAGTECDFESENLFLNTRLTSDGYCYTENEESVSIVTYVGEETRITLPTEINAKPVTALTPHAFAQNAYLERVEISSSVLYIGEGAFAGCKNLHTLLIPESVKSIGGFAAYTERQGEGFENLTVFFEANTLPEGAESGLIKYVVGVKAEDVCDDENFVYLRTESGYEIITVKNRMGAVTIPESYNSLPVYAIGKYALYGSTLTTSIQISDSVTMISEYAFFSSEELMAITVPQSVLAVGRYAFLNLPNCTVYVGHKERPDGWSEDWKSEIKEAVFESNHDQSSDALYLYEIVGDKLYLKSYVGTYEYNTPIIIPESIDGIAVYGIRKDCFTPTLSTTANNRYVFVIPSTVEVIESFAIRPQFDGHSDLYLGVSEIPSSWEYNWFNSSYNYGYDNRRNNVYYAGEWELVDGIPTPVQN